MCTAIIYVPKLNSVNPEGSIFSLLLIIYIIVLGFKKNYHTAMLKDANVI